MQAGAIGMSTGSSTCRVRTPARTRSSISRKSPRSTAASTLATFRNEGTGLLESRRRGDRHRRAVRLPGAVVASQVAGPGAYGLTKQSLPLIAEARARGLDVTIDVLPLRRVVVVARRHVPHRPGAAFDVIPAMIASVKYDHEKYEGRYISDIAADLDLPIPDAIRKILHDEENSPSVIMFVMEEEDVRRVVADDHCMIGSDGLPSEGKPHPRLYGTMARTIQQYVESNRCSRSRKRCAR